MGRTKTLTDSTTSTLDEETVDVEVKTESVKDESIKETPVIETSKKTDSKKTIDVNKTYLVENPKMAYKRVRALLEVYKFDSQGRAEVSGKDAEFFINAGFTLVE